MRILQKRFLVSIPTSKFFRANVFLNNPYVKEFMEVPEFVTSYINGTKPKDAIHEFWRVERQIHLGSVYIENAIQSRYYDTDSTYWAETHPQIVLQERPFRNSEEIEVLSAALKFQKYPYQSSNKTLITALESFGLPTTKLSANFALDCNYILNASFEYYKDSYSYSDNNLCLIFIVNSLASFGEKAFLQSVKTLLQGISDADILDVSDDQDFDYSSLAYSLEPILSKAKSSPVSPTPVSS